MKMKKTLAALLSVMLLVCTLTTGTFAAGGTYLSVEADKTEVSIGDTINYTVYLNGANNVEGGVWNTEFELDIPAGLTYVENSAKVADGFEATTGFSNSAVNEKYLNFLSQGAFGTAYTGERVAIVEFQCTVNADTDLTVGLAEGAYISGEMSEVSTTVDTTKAVLTVKAPEVPVAVTGVTLNKAELTLTEGKYETLTATVAPDDAANKAVTWTSSDESVAVVNNGKVTAVKAGTAVITVTTVDGGFTATCTVTVEAKPVDPKPDTPVTPPTPVPPTYTVNVPADIAGGTVTVSNTNPEQGEIITITATPNVGYKLTDVIINGVSYGPISPISYQVYGDLNITAVFTRINSFFDETNPTPSKPSMYDKILGMMGAFPNYTDVLPTDWFYNNVLWAWSRNILDNGTTLSPNADATRATIVEWIWRLEGRPVVNGIAFDDTSAMSTAWAASAGIVNGYGNGKFGPNDLVTREQLAAILYRYANYKGINTSARGDLSKFSDAGKISAYAVEPVQWAVGVGMINGYPNGTVQPQGNATRAELLALLNRMSVWYGI